MGKRYKKTALYYPSLGDFYALPLEKNIDVDETIVVIMNVLDKQSELPNWLVNTIYGSIRDSDAAFTRYFYGEVKKFVPKALKYFEEGSTRAPI
jgi:hypothetical protein